MVGSKSLMVQNSPAGFESDAYGLDLFSNIFNHFLLKSPGTLESLTLSSMSVCR